MIRILRVAAILVIVGGLTTQKARAEIILSPQEISQTLHHGPWPDAHRLDPSNRVSGDPSAIALGEALFSDPILSVDETMSCASCHVPELNFADGKPRAMGRQLLDRNTQALWNLQGQRWFGWDGENDNLWAQSLKPVLNQNELAHSETSLQHAIAQSAYREDFEAIFGPVVDQNSTETAVNLSKVLAAYLETLKTQKTSFDRFRDALEDDDLEAAGEYPLESQRGLRLFLGHGNCAFCHSGAAFSNGEFHDAGVPYFLEPGRVDPGRAGGLESLAESLFTLDSDYNDDPTKSGAWAVRNVRFQHGNFGIFRVPSLRRVAQTAPYMHDGSLVDLDAVLDHYNDINLERLHADGEAILRPLDLSEQDLADLKAFLFSLSDDASGSLK